MLRRIVVLTGMSGWLLVTGCASQKPPTESASEAIPAAPAVASVPSAPSGPTGPTGPNDPMQLVAPGPVDENVPTEFTETASGLRYRILRASDKRKPKSIDEVVVHYKGWLDSQKIFDSSYQRGETISFPLQGVIPGWTEGLQLVGEGGMIELEIPAKLGYGAQDMGDIPPNSRLHFLVELKMIR